MASLQSLSDRKVIKRLFLLLLCWFVIQLGLGGFLISQVALTQTSDALHQIANRVKGDVQYQNGTWNISRYNADPDVPDTYPLYLLSSDGFVIDRWKPLHGFLDTSDVKRLLSYQTPQTITTPTSQTWRIFSKPITQHGQTLGVVTVSYFNPPTTDMSPIDSQLQGAINTIAAKLVIKGNTIDASAVDPRDVSFDIAFQVVDSYNRIITKNNNTNSIDRIPNYIDASYVGDVINQSPERQVVDSVTHERFLLVTTPITDQHGYVVGALVVGKSIAFIGEIVRDFILAEAALGLVLVLVATIASLRLLVPLIEQTRRTQAAEQKVIEHLSFDKKTGALLLDEHEILIPYATNQFYLCGAVFAQPKHHWEIDELLERFGEKDLTNARKVYDAMVLLNKKVAPILGGRLVTMHDKTYQLNSTLLEKLL